MVQLMGSGMPYKDRKKQIAYQTRWMYERRVTWLRQHGPCKVRAALGISE